MRGVGEEGAEGGDDGQRGAWRLRSQPAHDGDRAERLLSVRRLVGPPPGGVLSAPVFVGRRVPPDFH